LEIVKGAKKKLVLDDTFKLAESEQKNAEAIFRNWYRQQAAKIIGDRVTFFAAHYQIPVDTIRITSARTRWGSCSPKNKLSFSWRLVMTPPDVIDYVVIHELAHTIHHNHSKRFWSLVEKWMPDYKERRKQLRQYGREII
jgi:predicted metal-dependent hydrolase